MPKRARGSLPAPATFPCIIAGSFSVALLLTFAGLCLPQAASAQADEPLVLKAAASARDPRTAAENVFPSEPAAPAVEENIPVKPKPPRDSQITIEGLVSYGNMQLFASGSDCKIDEAGVEYSTHIWGTLLRSRVDYVAEVVPFVLLNEPAEMTIWGTPLTSRRKILPGAAVLPMGIRWMWRDGTSIKPYLEVKGGVIAFTQKALNPQSSYESLNLVSSGGVALKLNDQFDLRLGLVGYLHFSNGFVVPVNPGVDFLNASMGLTYHLGSRRRAKLMKAAQ
ncbi:MAG TPA: acyloxyacyl hydrolase [Terracidiphilus sp.]|nr:acyloxyacyl hydrolase [Terracidiphilus sp.]